MRTRLLGLLLALGACGDDGGGMGDAGPPGPGAASLAQVVSYEGHPSLVNALTTADGADLSGAVVEVEAGSPIEIVEQRCTAARCGLVLRIQDTVPNRGQPVPAPIDGTNHFVDLRTADGSEYRALLSVLPLDTLSVRGTTPASVGQAVALASGLEVEAGAAFRAGTDAPLRWVVFGDARVAGTADLGPGEDGPVAGGLAGGAAGADATGEGAGAAGEGGAGAGGGGFVEAGAAGDGADDTPGEGGAGGEAWATGALRCLADFGAGTCGGGGGGATGAGGAGAGSMLLVALGTLDLGGATLQAIGAAGGEGAGGGAGGGFLLAGRSVVAPTTSVDVSGGAGEGRGGDGGAGALRLDAPGGEATVTGPAEGLSVGPSVELSGLSPLTDQPTLTLEGRAAADAMVAVDRDGAAVATGAADASGAWSLEVSLEPGLNRLAVVQVLEDGTRLRSWTGNNVELGPVSGAPRPFPIGATVDVVYLP